MDDLLTSASESARAAGRAVLRYAGAADLHVRSKGTTGAPVTTADLASQAVLIDALAPVGYAILSEERIDNHARTTYDRVWIVDPFNGTKEVPLHSRGFVIANPVAYERVLAALRERAPL